MSNATDLRKELEARANRLADEERTLRLTLEKLNAMGPQDPDTAAIIIPLGTTMAETELRMVLATLAWRGFNKTTTADTLGLSRRSIYNKLAEYAAAGAATCSRCPAMPPPDGPPWAVPNLCPPCASKRADEEERERRRHRKLSMVGAEAVIRRAAAGESPTALAREYNVSVATVKSVIAGKTYKDVPRPECTGPAVPAETQDLEPVEAAQVAA